MVSIKSFIATSAAIIASFATVEAAVAPSYPSPGTIQTQGTAYDITWTFDGKNPDVTYQIDFMTGSNDNQTVLENVAKGVKANALKYSFVAPEVSPNSAIYFFMFTGSDGQSYWTTRFGIVTPGGSLTAEPEKKQPNGDAIPWGTGQLLKNAANATVATAIATSSPIASSSAVVSSVAAASSSIATEATIAVASTTSATSSTSAAAVASNTKANAGSILKPVLTLVSVGAAAYFAL